MNDLQSHPLSDFFQIEKKARLYYKQFSFKDGSKLKVEYQKQYMINASVLIASEKLRKTRLSQLKNQSKRSLLPLTYNDVSTFNEYLQSHYNIKHTLPFSHRQCSRIWKYFFNSTEEVYNYETLISKKMKNQNAIKK